MLLDHLAGPLDIGVLGKLEFADLPGQHALGGYVEVGENARVAHLDDVLAESGEGVGAG